MREREKEEGEERRKERKGREEKDEKEGGGAKEGMERFSSSEHGFSWECANLSCGSACRSPSFSFPLGEMRAAVRGKGVGFGIYLSADDICQLNHDTDYIAEALRTLGDEQPRVAR